MEHNSTIVFDDYLKKAINKINKSEKQRTSMPDIVLSEKELEVLKGLAEGRDLKEINTAIKLNITNDSYNATVKRLLNKFEANSLAHLMYKAMKMGIIN